MPVFDPMNLGTTEFALQEAFEVSALLISKPLSVVPPIPLSVAGGGDTLPDFLAIGVVNGCRRDGI
ncbi:hypothetical protein QJS10_CPB19g00205 [Acorus calamus]|uniref:Uncharacterized protein n=1 Tax=Acorus calamus TaxID=4465 RepID=A0AAV9CHS0_ACOCL|nr:hypothetical protein QJS10_CPB19g00205 [Acorus calamus]